MVGRSFQRAKKRVPDLCISRERRGKPSRCRSPRVVEENQMCTAILANIERVEAIAKRYHEFRLILFDNREELWDLTKSQTGLTETPPSRIRTRKY